MDLSAGSPRPTPAAINRCGSRVWFSLITVNATWPGFRCFNPSLREISLQYGGKIDETRTMLQAAIPAFRRASSKLERRSRCFPTPLVRKIFFATNAMSRAGLRCLRRWSGKLLCEPKSSKHAQRCQSLFACHYNDLTSSAAIFAFEFQLIPLCELTLQDTGQLS